MVRGRRSFHPRSARTGHAIPAVPATPLLLRGTSSQARLRLPPVVRSKLEPPPNQRCRRLNCTEPITHRSRLSSSAATRRRCPSHIESPEADVTSLAEHSDGRKRSVAVLPRTEELCADLPASGRPRPSCCCPLPPVGGSYPFFSRPTLCHRLGSPPHPSLSPRRPNPPQTDRSPGSLLSSSGAIAMAEYAAAAAAGLPPLPSPSTGSSPAPPQATHKRVCKFGSRPSCFYRKFSIEGRPGLHPLPSSQGPLRPGLRRQPQRPALRALPPREQGVLLQRHAPETQGRRHRRCRQQ